MRDAWHHAIRNPPHDQYHLGLVSRRIIWCLAKWSCALSLLTRSPFFKTCPFFRQHNYTVSFNMLRWLFQTTWHIVRPLPLKPSSSSRVSHGFGARRSPTAFQRSYMLRSLQPRTIDNSQARTCATLSQDREITQLILLDFSLEIACASRGKLQRTCILKYSRTHATNVDICERTTKYF